MMLVRRLAVAGTIVAGLLSLPIHVPSAAAAAVPQSWAKINASSFHHSSPTVADVDGNGAPDIAIGDLDGNLHVYRRDGAELPGWPRKVVVPGSASPSAIESSPAIADLDGDGAAEVIVGAGSLVRSNQHGGVVVFNRNGSRRCGFRTADKFNQWTGGFPDGYSDGVFTSPAIGDVDGNGKPDVVFGGWDHNIWAIDRNCRTIPGFPLDNTDTVWSSPALYDSDGDGRMEIFIGGDATPTGGTFRALDWRGGAVHQLWLKRPGEIIQSSPAIGDINGDGRLEVVVGAGTSHRTSDSTKVFAWHLRDGSPVRGWPRNTGGFTLSSPALGDLTGDGRPEVVIGSLDGKVYAWRGTGSLLWSVFPDPAHPDQIVGSPVIADLDGDGRQDVVVGQGGNTFLLRGSNGGQLFDKIGTHWAYQNSPAVANFGTTGWNVVIAGFEPGFKRGRIASHRISAPGTTPAWPMFRKDALHLGAPKSGGNPLPPQFCFRPLNPRSTPSSQSSKGYWFLGGDGGVFSFNARFYGSLPGIGIRTRAISIDATPRGDGYWLLGHDGGVFSFGGARFRGSMGGRHLNAPIIAMEPTPSGNGYWLLGRDGGVFSFGDARFRGSTGGMRLNAPVIGMAATPSGRGYWLLARDGGVFTFGDARFRGSTGSMRLNAPIISMAPSPTGSGYWLLGRDGGVFSFGVRFYGSVPGTGLCSYPSSRQIRASSTGRGYWLLGSDGGVFSFGDAKFHGSHPGLTGPQAAVDLAIRR